MTTKTWGTIEQRIRRAAYDIAGAIMEVAEEDLEDENLSSQIEQAADWKNMGTDGDLSDADRVALMKLAARAKKHGL